MAQQVVFWIWKAWEFLFRFFGHVRPLRKDEPYLFYVAKRRYLGKPFVVDGVMVKRFDLVVELHMNNSYLVNKLRRQTSLVGLAVQLVQEAKRSLPVLAESLSASKFDGIQVVYGITFIHRSVERFGFHTLPIQRRLWRNLATWHLTHVFRIVNPNADEILLHHPGVFEPKMVAISKQHLLSTYGPGNHTQSAVHSTNHALT